MRKIFIIHVGNLKEDFYKNAVSEYEKRTNNFYKIENIQIREEKLSNEPNDLQIAAALRKESERIIERIPAGTYKIALCSEGKRFSSESFSCMLDEVFNSGRHTGAAFIIGGSYGMSPELKKSCSLLFSLSDMTFPRQLSRVVLIEQLYRAQCISEGKRYHK